MAAGVSAIGSSSHLRRKATRAARKLGFLFDCLRIFASRQRARWRSDTWLTPLSVGLEETVCSRPASGAIRAEKSRAWSDEESPQVSIVVPVYNHLDDTKRCLQAVTAMGSARQFELIVVDDGSTDGTTDWLSRQSGVRTHRMPQNSGFVHACNAGAALARGQYLVFLNNDTEVRAGWLDVLIGTLETAPHCGLVGARLIYPDGRLQEAGGIVLDDGGACNYGRGADPTNPAYTYLREVDYCSGACIALPLALFQSLGGFDRRYAPAYYEDTDLAFAVRDAGYQVIYEPRAQVLHFEGRTAGVDSDSGVKQYQKINQQKFVEKWCKALTEQPSAREFALAPERCVGHRCDHRVLILDVDFPHVDRDSGSVRMFNVLLLLRELGCHVLFWATGTGVRDDDARMLERHGVEIVLAPSRVEALHWWYDHGESVDLVLLSRLPIAQASMRLARRYASQARLVFDTVDLHFLRVARGAALRHDREQAAWAEQLRRTELKLMECVDLTLVVSEYERNLLSELVPTVDVRVLSNVHDVYGCSRPFGARSGLLFLGNFRHEPNVDAVRWLIDEIMPRLRQRMHGVTLHVVGYAADAVLEAEVCDDVQVHGFVADLEPIMSQVRLALAPLRYGAGVKGKISMAMSHGVPVVTTTIGAEGMDLVDRSDALIADAADAFADAIAEGHANEALWALVSRRGLEHVRRHFSRAAARAVLEEILP